MVADKPISLKFPFLQGIDCLGLAISNQLIVLFLKAKKSEINVRLLACFSIFYVNCYCNMYDANY